jgi:hypothetical protein
MSEFVRRVGAGELVVACAPGLEKLAHTLLAALAQRDRIGPALRAGSRTQFGWSVLTLRAEAGRLRVCEPDFAGDLANNLSDRVDRTLEVIRDQSEVLRRAGAEGMDARWDVEIVVVPESALDAPAVFLRREEPSGPDDSGWLIGNLDDPPAPGDTEGATAIRVHRLLKRRPFLLRALAFPTGWFVAVRDNEILDVRDASGRPRWPAVSD